MQPTDVVDASLAAYNARDLDAFMAWFDPAIEIFDLHEAAVATRGLEAVRARYRDMFAASPALHSRILQRIVLADLVTDHELVTGRVGGDVEFLITYRIVDGLIRRIWVARSPITGPVIVRAGAPDAAALAELGRTTYADHFAAIWSAGGLQHYLDREFDLDTVRGELASTSVIYLLAIAASAGSSHTGYAKLRLSRAVPGTEQLGVELQKLYLRGSTVGRRTGARLLEAVEAEALAAGIPTLWLDVLETNTGAIRFYERHGFRVVGKLPFATDLAEHGLRVMTKELRRPAGT